MVSNSTIKLVQSLKHKKYRQKYNLFVVEGWKSITTVLSQQEIIVERIFTSNPIDLKTFLQTPEIIEASDLDIKKLSHLQSPADTVALVRLKGRENEELDTSERIINFIKEYNPDEIIKQLQVPFTRMAGCLYSIVLHRERRG